MALDTARKTSPDLNRCAQTMNNFVANELKDTRLSMSIRDMGEFTDTGHGWCSASGIYNHAPVIFHCSKRHDLVNANCLRTVATKAKPKRILPLPKQENWKKLYASARRIKRNCLADLDYADYFVKQLLGGEANLHNRTVLEYMPGPGLITKSLLRHNAKGVIVLEYEPSFLQTNMDIAKQHPKDTLTVLPYHSSLAVDAWRSSEGIFAQIPTASWDILRSDLLITGMLNMGRFQILSRFLHNIMSRQHMFHFGRVEAIMVCDEKTIDTALASLGDKECRPLSIWTQGCANIEVIDDNVPSDAFWLKMPTPMKVIRITPFVKPLLYASPEVLHYVMTMLYTRKRQSLSTAIRTLAPDAIELLDDFKGDPDLPVYQLTLDQINQITMKFDYWSKRPPILNETLALL
ncbi:S-adenosyl-L-methionine-dependent methyltransferase [Syncephalis pseudoplumigaleata]|uniref:rRNA adenine N(6)-methyltransferase n=1 Tax=Syncephalis pseudoplumigaleata TaxID=1712513 RepID=A0A4P9YZJ0_9FUNG|nr:S-adenosyl-L-methionine-dependent methyltransferase [Syncephalis pseudoplumigaleata]|eukprot:RKP25365.1 S-adenosyl-L-methionine-dependent methyltransferase [Syncephalis pseudoplumigaleata]